MSNIFLYKILKSSLEGYFLLRAVICVYKNTEFATPGDIEQAESTKSTEWEKTSFAKEKVENAVSIMNKIIITTHK